MRAVKAIQGGRRAAPDDEQLRLETSKMSASSIISSCRGSKKVCHGVKGDVLVDFRIQVSISRPMDKQLRTTLSSRLQLV